MKKYLALPLLAGLSFASNASFYEAKVEITEVAQGMSIDEASVVSVMNMQLESNKESIVLSTQEIPFIKVAQPKISYWGKIFGADYDYDTVEIGTNYKLKAMPDVDNNNILLNFNYEKTSLDEMKRLEFNGGVYELPSTNSHNVSATVKFNLSSEDDCKIISSYVKDGMETAIKVCLREMG